MYTFRRLHKAVSHPHVVQLYSVFEDPNFVYLVLELCRHGSLCELIKRRKTITEYESRYFVHQILMGCKYLHDKKIIHR